MTLDGTVFVILALLTALGRFAAFTAALGKEAGGPIAPRSALDRESFVVMAFRLLERFMSNTFGERILEVYPNWKLLAIIAALGIALCASAVGFGFGHFADATNAVSEGLEVSRVLALCILIGPALVIVALLILSKYGQVLAVSSFFVLGLMVFSNALDASSWSETTNNDDSFESFFTYLIVTLLCVFVLILSNAIFETITVLFARLALRPFSRAQSVHLGQSIENPMATVPVDFDKMPALGGRPTFFAVTWRMLLFALVSFYCFFTNMNIAFTFLITIRGVANGYLPASDFAAFVEIQRAIYDNETWMRLSRPIAEAQAIPFGNATLLEFCILPLVPALFILLALVTGLLMDLIDLGSGRALSRKLEAAQSSGSGLMGVLTVVSVVGGALAALFNHG
ncbi:MAG: hypothetical protein AAFX00_00020 [Pseudomonadota bacterium]